MNRSVRLMEVTQEAAQLKKGFLEITFHISQALSCNCLQKNYFCYSMLYLHEFLSSWNSHGFTGKQTQSWSSETALKSTQLGQG